MIPLEIKYDGNATPPQFTDNNDQIIERGTHIRVKIKGIRGEVGQMYAIATIKEDYLGYATSIYFFLRLFEMLIRFKTPSRKLIETCQSIGRSRDLLKYELD